MIVCDERGQRWWTRGGDERTVILAWLEAQGANPQDVYGFRVEVVGQDTVLVTDEAVRVGGVVQYADRQDERDCILVKTVEVRRPVTGAIPKEMLWAS